MVDLTLTLFMVRDIFLLIVVIPFLRHPVAPGGIVEGMRMSQLNQVIEQTISETSFSGVVFVKLDGNVEFENAYGYADRSNKIPNTVDTRFGIASGTKFLTALGIGTLIDRGKLSLTSRLCDCVNIDFPHISEDVAIHHLLTHTSGVYDYYDEELVEDIDNFQCDIPCFELKGPKDYIPLFRDGKMKFDPGERFSYSNGGFILLGIVIEEISGTPYIDFIQENIFESCDMSDSGFLRWTVCRNARLSAILTRKMGGGPTFLTCRLLDRLMRGLSRR